MPPVPSPTAGEGVVMSGVGDQRVVMKVQKFCMPGAPLEHGLWHRRMTGAEEGDAGPA